jgi:transposase-like protein
MKKKGFTPEQIITMLREAEVLLSQGSTAVEAARKLGITEQTYYRWRKEYGGMKVDQARRFKELRRRIPGSRSSSLISPWTMPS